ncbi:MAG: hypothetical protein M0P64_02170 [Candidatus Pacebacteria bacterium]|jgi:hypothetical protein|nr:hypothetical protein [Candidatus Paceibacterota bacterium]
MFITVGGLAGGVVHVDRAGDLMFPDWEHRIIQPSFESFGPIAFVPKSLETWFHKNQESGVPMIAEDLLLYLEQNKMRERCLGLYEAQAIQKKGIRFYREHFGSEIVLCWKCVIARSDGLRYVPFLAEATGREEVVLGWFPVDCRRHIDAPVYLFPAQ